MHPWRVLALLAMFSSSLLGMVLLDHAGQLPATVVIDVRQQAAAPVTIAVGDTATWINADTMVHQLVIDGVETTHALAPRQSWTVRFPQPGVYQFRCRIHHDVHGEITVTQP